MVLGKKEPSGSREERAFFKFFSFGREFFKECFKLHFMEEGKNHLQNPFKAAFLYSLGRALGGGVLGEVEEWFGVFSASDGENGRKKILQEQPADCSCSHE